MTTRLPTHLPRPPSPSTDTPFLPSLSTRPFHRCLPPSPHILGHPQRYVRETRTPYYEKRCSRSEPRHFPDCLAAFTRRLLTAGSYSRVAYYAFVGGRFSSILSFSRFTTPASASPLSLSLFCSFRLRPSVVPTQAKEALASLCTPRRTAEHRNRKPCLERAYVSRLSSMSVPSDVRSFARFL